MAGPRQGDLFGQDQADPSDEDHETPTYYPDPDEIRAKLYKILAEARAAQSMPWDEGAQLRFQFEEELARLEAA